MIKSKFHDEGFTLVELVVVIAVLAILSAVAIPAFVGVMLKARQMAALTYVDATLKSGLIFNSKEDRWPQSWDEFSQNMSSNNANEFESCTQYNSQCEGNQRAIVSGQYLIEFYIRGNELRVSAWRMNNVGPTASNRSVWGCLNLAKGGQMYAWQTDNYYQGPSWEGPMFDDDGNALNMCGQNS